MESKINKTIMKSSDATWFYNYYEKNIYEIIEMRNNLRSIESKTRMQTRRQTNDMYALKLEFLRLINEVFTVVNEYIETIEDVPFIINKNANELLLEIKKFNVNVNIILDKNVFMNANSILVETIKITEKLMKKIERQQIEKKYNFRSRQKINYYESEDDMQINYKL